MRIDLLLVEWGIAPSRTKAQELIKTGNVERLNSGKWETVLSASLKCDKERSDLFRLRSGEILQFVSRGGLKLAHALDHLNFDVAGLVAVDIGISTGGFADCLLQRGVKKVIGIDVGTGQLADRLKCDPRVESYEKVNVRHIAGASEAIINSLREAQLCVVDVSFISLTLVLEEVAKVLPSHHLLALIKPQFELDQSCLSRSGVVNAEADHVAAKERVQKAAVTAGYKQIEIFPSEFRGGDGNQEFFLWAELRG